MHSVSRSLFITIASTEKHGLTEEDAPAIGPAETVLVTIDLDVGELDPVVVLVRDAPSLIESLDWWLVSDQAFAFGAIVHVEDDELRVGAHLDLYTELILSWWLLANTEFQLKVVNTIWVHGRGHRVGALIVTE